MLKLENIKKSFKTGDFVQQALKGVSLEFRENEFVAILGTSGSGKTTLLNIIGGLDRYDEGDLIINGKSTKKFKDKEWDAYRNNSVGFIFQSYNLITHISVLANVEMSMTLSGVSGKEKRKRALEVLEKVGLKDHAHKKPNQLSGGQMQRVAIARALVNNPDIILADEPTGALDSATSVQIMELIKEIAKDKLVIMVTHNPDLAKDYANRIVELKDGNIISDSNPIDSAEKKEAEYKLNKTSMSFLAALHLSFTNLLTKKGRTFLTAFAGSIGIIGIALILSLSNGVQNYINKVEEDTLSSYPITIEEATVDMGSMLESLMGEGEDKGEAEEGKIHSQNVMTDMFSMVSSKVQNNNLKELKQYLDGESNAIKDNSNAIQYSYNLNLNLYKDSKDEVIQVNPSQVPNIMGMVEAQNNSPAMGAFVTYDVWMEMLDNKELLESQYDVLAGKWPDKYNEVVLIVGENSEISDYTLYSLGILDQKELEQKYKDVQAGKEVNAEDVKTYTYEEILNLSFKLLLNTDYYQKNNNLWLDKSDDEKYMKEKLENAETIKVVGILKANEEAVATAMSEAVGYTSELKEYVINKIKNEEIIKEQLDNEKINVFTGLEFVDNTQTSTSFDYTALSPEQQAYMQNLSDIERANLISAYASNTNATYENNLKKLGYVNLDEPSMISIFPKDFDSKEKITDGIEEYNQKQRDDGKDENVITYSDLVGTMMKSVTSIINVISYVLIAFVSISLIVSSIMIGIITYISVLERTKEIGILRAMGASKKDISRVFNAETFIVGLISGALGIGVTLLLLIPANVIIKAIVGVSGIAALPVTGGVVLIIISMVLTVIAGLIPSKMAAKKDPVEALRTE